MDYSTIVSGYLKAKFNNKFLARYQRRYAELVFVYHPFEEAIKTNSGLEEGHYEMRLYKKDKKTGKALFAFEINPQSLSCSANPIKQSSKKHRFSFVCTSDEVSLVFSTNTVIERDAWVTVFQQLEWQYCAKQIPKKRRVSSMSNSDVLFMSANDYNAYVQNKDTEDNGNANKNSNSNSNSNGDSANHNNNNGSVCNKEHSHSPSCDSCSQSSRFSSTSDSCVRTCDYDIQNNTFVSTPTTDEIREYYVCGNLWKDNDLCTVTNTQSPCVCSRCSGTKFTILGLLNDDAYVSSGASSTTDHSIIIDMDDDDDTVDTVDTVDVPASKPPHTSPITYNSHTNAKVNSALQYLKSPVYTGIRIAGQ